jgi:hypothetical protein
VWPRKWLVQERCHGAMTCCPTPRQVNRKDDILKPTPSSVPQGPEQATSVLKQPCSASLVSRTGRAEGHVSCRKEAATEAPVSKATSLVRR